MGTSELHAAQGRLVDLVSVQPGSVVSKTLIDRSTGTVTLFAFDKGQRFSEHTAPFDALVMVLQGTVDIVLDGQHHAVTPGEAIIMPAGSVHAVDALEPCIWMLTMIRS
ncbi:MAG TPA: cupin domain-containing protein [Candidatus Cryosericum sp.]|nr:cupin domain-containing protein [Candidatus Cryosericum sp.]HPS69151.1 cupin domain-containing protein [Candidatus Cryosericum sp.]